MADPDENNSLENNDKKVVSIPDELIKARKKFEERFPAPYFSKPDNMNDYLNINDYILINGESVASLIGKEWRKEKKEEEAGAYIDYQFSDQYKERTEALLENAIKDNKTVKIFVPNSKLEFETTILNMPDRQDGLVAKKEAAALETLEQIAFFDFQNSAQLRIHRDMILKTPLQSSENGSNSVEKESQVDEKRSKLNSFFTKTGSRGEGAAFILAKLLKDGKSIEEIYNPTKLIQEKQNAAIELCDQMDKGGEEFTKTCCEIYVEAAPKLAEYSKSLLEKYDISDPKQFHAKELIFLNPVHKTFQELDKVGDVNIKKYYNSNQNVEKLEKYKEASLHHDLYNGIDRAFVFGKKAACFVSGDDGYQKLGTNKNVAIATLISTYTRKKFKELSHSTKEEEQDYLSQLVQLETRLMDDKEACDGLDNLLDHIEPHAFTNGCLNDKLDNLCTFSVDYEDGGFNNYVYSFNPQYMKMPKLRSCLSSINDSDLKKKLMEWNKAQIDADGLQTDIGVDDLWIIEGKKAKTVFAELAAFYNGKTVPKKKWEEANECLCETLTNASELEKAFKNKTVYFYKKNEAYPYSLTYQNGEIIQGERVDRLLKPDPEPKPSFFQRIGHFFNPSAYPDVEEYNKAIAANKEIKKFVNKFEPEAKRRKAEIAKKGLKEQAISNNPMPQGAKLNNPTASAQPLVSEASPNTEISLKNENDDILVEGISLSHLIARHYLKANPQATLQDYKKYIQTDEFKNVAEGLNRSAKEHKLNIENKRPDENNISLHTAEIKNPDAELSLFHYVIEQEMATKLQRINSDRTKENRAYNLEYKKDAGTSKQAEPAEESAAFHL